MARCGDANCPGYDDHQLNNGHDTGDKEVDIEVTDVLGIGLRDADLHGRGSLGAAVDREGPDGHGGCDLHGRGPLGAAGDREGPGGHDISIDAVVGKGADSDEGEDKAKDDNEDEEVDTEPSCEGREVDDYLAVLTPSLRLDRGPPQHIDHFITKDGKKVAILDTSSDEYLASRRIVANVRGVEADGLSIMDVLLVHYPFICQMQGFELGFDDIRRLMVTRHGISIEKRTVGSG